MSTSMEQAIAHQAGAWVFRLQDDRSDECRAEFATWLQTSPQHVAEFLLATATNVELGGLDAARRIDVDELLGEVAPNVLPLSSPPRAARRSRWKRLELPLVIAAGLAMITLAFVGFRLPTYRTGIGEQLSVKLDDGSLVQLNTRSCIEVRYSGAARAVRLIEGEALFTVAPQSGRPFLVESGSARVQAVGTQFNVYRRADRADVSVVEGRVKITTARADGVPAPILLDAGQEAAIERNGRIVKSSAPQVGRALAWRQRHLEFHSATVAEVAAEFNRYNRLQIRIADEAIGNRTMSGVFNADEPQSLLDFLANEGGIRFENTGDAVTLHPAPSP